MKSEKFKVQSEENIAQSSVTTHDQHLTPHTLPITGPSSRITGRLYWRLVEGCKLDAQVYTLEAMVENFAEGIMRALRAPRSSRS